MTLEEFVDAGFRDHAEDAEGVWRRMPDGLALADSPRRTFLLANLATHVAGEHLGRWDDGLAFLGRIASLPAFDAATAEGKGVRRLEAVLHLCAGRLDASEARLALAQPGGALPPDSARIRMLLVAAAALAHQGRIDDANALLDDALRRASYGPGKDDPAARELAVTCHNMASAFQDLPSRSDAATALMLRAAHVSRGWWEVAGDWRNVERAEYRLAMTHLAAGRPHDALRHARECLRIVEENGDEPAEAFFAHWTVARALVDCGDRDAARAARDRAVSFQARVEDPEYRDLCASELAALDALLAS